MFIFSFYDLILYCMSYPKRLLSSSWRILPFPQSEFPPNGRLSLDNIWRNPPTKVYVCQIPKMDALKAKVRLKLALPSGTKCRRPLQTGQNFLDSRSWRQMVNETSFVTLSKIKVVEYLPSLWRGGDDGGDAGDVDVETQVEVKVLGLNFFVPRHGISSATRKSLLRPSNALKLAF